MIFAHQVQKAIQKNNDFLASGANSLTKKNDFCTSGETKT